MDAREPKEVEDARTAIFVKGTHTGEVVAGAMKELVRLIPGSLGILTSEFLVTDGTQTSLCDFVLEKE